MKDVELLAALQVIIDNSLPKSKKVNSNKPKKRKFGFGKGTFTYVADDFDASLEDFKDYRQK
ncbi:MAG: DUF2281 domain-containing protein [Chitinophagales bacterium]